MASSNDFPARGRITGMRGNLVVFAPLGTTYDLYLEPIGGRYDDLVGRRVDALIRVAAGKVMTVPSGGNFLVPISGPPRIVQGRILYLDEHQMVVQAGTSIIVDLPTADTAYDLAHGPLAAGVLVNLSLLPGAAFQVVSRPTGK